MKEYKIKNVCKIIIEVLIVIILFSCIKKYFQIFKDYQISFYFLICLGIVFMNINEIFELFSKEGEGIKKLFNIYYINYQKVFEICMLMDNSIKNKVELNYKNELHEKKSASANVDFNKRLKVLPNVNLENSNTRTYEYKELQEIKNTNSTYLSKLIDYCQDEDCKELINGTLLKINDVTLEIINKDEIAQVNSMLSGIFKDNTIPTDSEGQTFNLNINAITNILLKDYKYNIKGKSEKLGEFYISIPIKGEKEFENDYSIYDLEVGKVNIIGIYRNDKYQYKKNNNTFNYLVDVGENEKQFLGDELIKSNTSNLKKEKKSLLQELPYIDLIAIVQDLNIGGGKKDE